MCVIRLFLTPILQAIAFYIFVLYVCTDVVSSTLWDVLVADHLQGRNSLTCTHSAESAAPPICVPSCGALSPLSQSHETRGLVSVASGAVKHAAHTRTRTKRVLRTPSA